MASESWNIERSKTQGVRATVKVWPEGMRYRLMRGEWYNTGHEERDFYLSRVGLRKRIRELEETFTPEVRKG